MLLLNVGYAQQASNISNKDLPSTNYEKLQQLSEEWAVEWENNYNEALKKARQNGWLIRDVQPDGTVIQLVGLKANGEPRYYITHNEDAAETISTSDIWPSGQSGFNLTGQNELIGEWDGGKVLTTHQEFGGRAVQADGATDLSEHATHVAGTMIAQGIRSGTRGMAYQADLNAFDWLSDESEMANQASNNLLISNHSYGSVGGFRHIEDSSVWVWYGDTDISTQEDYRFGFYNNEARRWDQIAKNAPYYLIVKSAGNDRNDGPDNALDSHYVRNDQFQWEKSFVDRGKDGDYDCITPKGVAKNVLTVGAVKDIPGGYNSPSDVEMTDFSSWGPADDGRIKPDLVANGKDVYSTFDGSNQDYGTKSGTSMATPSVTGSLLLLQSLYKDLHGGDPMKAASLKGLAIHTADEAGNTPGPDYKFGWGLMNTAKAADLIRQDTGSNNIQELTLNNNQSTSLALKAKGSEPLVATICWTDEPGNSPSTSLDPRQPMLVNDLDLRISDSSNKTFKPWKLDPTQPAKAAVKGDNDVDNVEKVVVPNPVPGATYSIKIDHKGSLANNQQDVSLILSGLASESVNITCQDTTRINANSGFVEDGSATGSYANNADCYWEITANDGEPLHLDFTKMQVTNPGDTLFIYEGQSTNNNLIKTLTGDLNPGRVFTGTDQIMLHFKTNESFTNKGWAFQFGSYDQDACWGPNLMNYVQAGSVGSGFIWEIRESYASNPSSRFKLSEAGQAFTDWVDLEGETLQTDFPLQLDSFNVGITHENNSGQYDTFDVYVQALDSTNFPSGPILWEGHYATNQSLSPSGDYNSSQNAVNQLSFYPDILINQPFFIGVTYRGARTDSASIVGYFENVGTAGSPEATEADLGQAYRKLPLFGSSWIPRKDGTEDLYIDRNNNNVYDKGSDEAPYFQTLLISSFVSKATQLPDKPEIIEKATKLVARGGYDNYRWFLDGNLMQGETDSTLSLNNADEGTYQVYVYDAYQNCGVASDGYQYEKDDTSSSSKLEAASNTIQIFPNPSDGEFHLTFEDPEAINFYRIVNSQGQVITNKGGVTSSKTTIDLGQQPAGIYFLEIQTGDGIKREKLIKQ